METNAQKTARLRALRYQRDGSPEQNKEKAKTAAAEREQLKRAVENDFLELFSNEIRTNPANVVSNLDIISKIFHILNK